MKIKLQKLFFLVAVFFLAPHFAQAAAPQIQAIANDASNTGVTYTKTPVLTAGGTVTWRKEFGPDDMTVDPNTGAVSWAIPASLPREAFHLGVRATNTDGSVYVTWILKVGGGNYVYVNGTTGNDSTGTGALASPYKTISKGNSAAASGDTIVVQDGTYTGAANMTTNFGGVGQGTLPPKGSAGIYTTLMSEHPGGAIVDGGGTLYPFWLEGNYQDRAYASSGGSDIVNSNATASYLAIKGFLAHSSGGTAQDAGPIQTNHADHIKIIDCGSYDGATDGYGPPIYIGRSDHVLVEGCYAYGLGRYMIIAYISDNVIFRRNVARMDRTIAGNPIGVYQFYASQNAVGQNNIAVDSDQYTHYLNWDNVAGLFDMHSGGDSYAAWAAHVNNKMYSSIALNNSSTMALTTNVTNGLSTPPEFHNMLIWDLKVMQNNYVDPTGGDAVGLNSPDSLLVDQGTFGNWSSPYGSLFPGDGSGAFFSGRSVSPPTSRTMTNSIITGLQDYNAGNSGVFYQWENANYNDIYNTGTINKGSSTVNNTISTNPMTSCIKYLPKLEDGCSLLTAGQSGARVGANIMFMRGKSGTLWGEAGYDTEESTPMWPFPHENLTAAKMKLYTATDSVGTVSGDRGFAHLAGIQTYPLSYYVFNYLGSSPLVTDPATFYGPMAGVCGSPGTVFTLTSDSAGLCSTGTVTSGTFAAVSGGWTWGCDGVAGGSPTVSNACSATLDTRAILLGNMDQTQGSNDTDDSNSVTASLASPTKTGPVQSLSIYLPNAGGSVVLGIYANVPAASGILDHPGSRLAFTDSFTATSGWNTHTLSASSPVPTLDPALKYWLAFDGNGNATNNLTPIKISTGSSTWMTQTFGTLPTTFTYASANNFSGSYAMYATLSSASDTVAPTAPSGLSVQ